MLTRDVSYVQPPSEDPEQIQIHILIPAKYVGAISGCNCSATNRGSGARRIIMIGTYDQAEVAQTMIWEQMRAAFQEANEVPPANMNAILLVRREAAGAV